MEGNREIKKEMIKMLSSKSSLPRTKTTR